MNIMEYLTKEKNSEKLKQEVKGLLETISRIISSNKPIAIKISDLKNVNKKGMDKYGCKSYFKQTPQGVPIYPLTTEKEI